MYNNKHPFRRIPLHQILHHRLAGIAGLFFVSAMGAVQADLYPPLFGNTDSSETVVLQTTEAFSTITDIDSDGKADAVTLAESSPDSSSCQSLRVHRSTTLSDGTLLADDPATQLIIYNTGYFVDDQGCGPVGKLEVIGDINADGRRDLAVLITIDDGTDYPLQPRIFTAVIFTPSDAGMIDLLALDGTNGFVVDNTYVTDAGDVNGDGYADMTFYGDNSLVVGGKISYEPNYDVYTLPEDLVLIRESLSGGDFTSIGDINGDSRDDLLVGRINEVNQYAIVYGEAGVVPALSSPSIIEGQYMLNNCAVSFGCNIFPAGDFNGDGYDDIAVSRFGCGFTYEAAILYGGPNGITPRESISDYSGTELTRITDTQSGGCLAGQIFGTPGDMDGDGSHELYLRINNRGSEELPSRAILFGTDNQQPDFITIDEIDGTNGFGLALSDYFEDAQLAGIGPGVDIDGDGFLDLLDTDYDDGNPLNTGLSANPRLAIRGKDRELDPAGPRNLVVEQLSHGWQARWSLPPSGNPLQYRVLLDNDLYETVDSGTLEVLLPDSVSGPFVLEVQALSSDGNIIGSTLRQVPARIVGENLSANVFGPKLIELVFNQQAPWYSQTYLVWRNDELLTLASEGADGFWDSTTEAGNTYTYYLTPLYSRFNDVSSQAALRERPVLQRRSNSITITTPGGSDDPGDTDEPDDTDEPGGSETITVTGNVISWSASGWHQVQTMDDYISVCEGGTECVVSPGRYVVINHDSGERFDNIVVEGQDTTAAVQVEGNTITWPDDGWYQIQDASTYTSLCEGGQSCEVPQGNYIVINHTTGQRWENIQVSQSDERITVVGQTIFFPDDDWYQVQNSSTYESLCEGVSSCDVPEGTYIVINHTSGERYENVLVPPLSDQPAEQPDDTDSVSIQPTNIRLEIYGATLGELFWDNAEGVVSTEVYRDAELIGVSEGTSFFDGTRVVDIPHQYELIAVDSDGNRSEAQGFGVFEDYLLELDGFPPVSNDEQAIALSGDTAAAMVYEVASSRGARGLRIIERTDAGQWELVQSISTGEPRWDSAVALENDTLVTGTLGSDDIRSDFNNNLIYNDYDYSIYERDTAGFWNQLEIQSFSDALLPNLSNGYVSVALDDNTAMLGGRNNAVYVFSRTTDGQWLETQKLTAAGDGSFGYSISIEGDTAVLGYLGNSDSTDTIHVFTRDVNGQWSETQIITPDPGEANQNFSAVVNADAIVVNGYRYFQDGEYLSNHYVYAQELDGNWTQSQVIAVDDAYNTSIALDNTTLVIGAPGNDGLTQLSGAVHVYKRNAGEWVKTIELIASTGMAALGSSIAVDANQVLTHASSRELNPVATAHFFSLPVSPDL